MKKQNPLIVALAATLLATPVFAQSNLYKKGADKKATATPAQDTVRLGYNNSLRQVSVMSTKPFTLGAPTEAWVSATALNGGVVRLQAQASTQTNATRLATIPLLIDGAEAGRIVVEQAANTSAGDVSDTRVRITSATASSMQSGSGDIRFSYDNDVNTIYHSSWAGGGFPITLEYVLGDNPHVDYMVYTPRSGGGNGDLGQVTISYSTKNAPNAFTTLTNKDFGMAGIAQQVQFGNTGIDNVARVRVVVHSGFNNFASAAEIGFYTKDQTMQQEMTSVFADALCTQLKPGVTDADIAALSTPYLRLLAQTIKAGDYSTEFRVGEYEPYEPYAALQRRLKTQFQYSHYENPTGIYFEASKPIVAFVTGLPEGVSTALTIKNFGQKDTTEAQLRSSYVLSNGYNVINPTHRGNGYVSYYTPDYATAPNIKVHFAMATETGYFDLAKHDDAKWRSLLANAVSDIMDVRGHKLQGAYPVKRLKQHSANSGVQVATNGDKVVQIQHDLMGLTQYNKAPKNRMQTIVAWNGFMHASTEGAYAHDNSIWAYCSENVNNLDLWGMAHELGHVNQLPPNWHYSGLKEVTNNLNACMTQYTLKRASGVRLEEVESERAQAFIENAIRKGQPWLNQEGDGKYFGSRNGETETVRIQNYDGTMSSKDTTLQAFAPDVFMTVLPLWQMQLYGQIAGFAPNIWAKIHEGLRNVPAMTNPSGGRYQIEMMRLVCDSTGIDFLPFFEKVGMLKPINARIIDYSTGWQRINQEMIDELKADIARKNLRPLEGLPWFITAVTVDSYKNKLDIPTTNAVNAGCSAGGVKRAYQTSYNTILVDMNVWPNVVCFETYDAAGNLLHYTMPGFGGGYNQKKTYVAFPSNAKTIKAVNWNGTQSITVYEKN